MFLFSCLVVAISTTVIITSITDQQVVIINDFITKFCVSIKFLTKQMPAEIGKYPFISYFQSNNLHVGHHNPIKKKNNNTIYNI